MSTLLRMNKFSFLKQLVIIYLLIQFIVTHAESPLFEKIEKFGLRCDVNNSKYWDLIEWYFERTPYVIATTLTESHRDKRDASTLFLMKLTDLKLSVYLSKVDYYNEEDTVSYANTFDWRGQKYELRLTEKLMRNKREIELNAKTKETTQRRLDEPEQGALVFAHKIDILNKYLVGTPRRPFHQPRKYFILIVTQVEAEWKKTGSIVLERLWKSYGIIHAMLIAPCSATGESVIGQYDPFYLNESITNPLSTSFGRCTWTNIDDFEFDIRVVRKLASLNKFPLRVSLFPRYPTVLLPNQVPPVFAGTYFTKVSVKTNNYSGLDAIVLGNMAEAIDFKPDIRKPTGNDYGDYGYKLNNGTFIGSLGDVLYRRVYASFNGRFISDYDTDDIEYMFPSYSDQVCVIAPKALKVPQWLAIFKCFNVYVWVLIVVVNNVCGYFWYLLKLWTNRKDNPHMVPKSKHLSTEEFNRLSVISIEMWTIMLGGASRKLPLTSMERIFLGVCLVSNVIIAESFQGSLFTAYSRTTYFKDINTLEELDKSGLPIGTSSASLKDFFSGVGTAVLESLNSKFKVVSANGVIEQTASKRDICCLERLADIKVIIAKRYENNDGTVQLHPINECPRSYYLSYIVKKGWPFKPVFDNVIERYFEGGLLAKWHAVVEESIIYKERISRLHSGSHLKQFSLMDMQTAFYILGIGLFCCLLVLLGEIYHHQKYSCRHIKTICDCRSLKLKCF